MKGRSLALFFLLYLSLDVANPFMPGAVTFVDGAVAVVDAGRPSGLDLPMPALATHTGGPRDEPPLIRTAATAAVAPRPQPTWVRPRYALTAAGSDQAPSPEDH